MKLLLDQNLSPRLVQRLADVFPGSQHVQTAGLDRAGDEEIWAHARKHGLAVVTKDEDFNDMSVVRGSPPKVIWLQMRNCTTAEVESLLRDHHKEIETFAADPHVGTMILRRP